MVTGRIACVSVLFAITVSAGCFADPAPRVPAKMAVETAKTEIAPDGSTITVLHQEMQVLDASVIQSIGQQTISYSELLQDVTVDEAYTLKADGRKIPVAPSAIITQQRPAKPGVTELGDQKQKVILYPNVEVGDTLISTRTTKSQPKIPGLFTTAAAVAKTRIVTTGTLTLTTPKTAPLYFDTKGLVVNKREDGGKLIYSVSYSNNELDRTPSAVSAFDTAPYAFISNFKTWDQFVKAYLPLVQSKLAVTPALQAKADEITAGTTDPREQVKLIAEWVSSRVRYVAIEFGKGGVVPHDPGEILHNAYGDCKDHSILFAVLLKAKGIAADLVLVNASDNYTVPAVPTLSVFNHMINYVPSLGIYVDTTQRAMPFGYVPRSETGKTVVHLNDSGSPVRKVPNLAAKDFVYAYVEHQSLDASGKLSGDGVVTANGAAAGFVNRLTAGPVSADTKKIAERLLEKRGLSEATGFYTLPPTGPVTLDFRATSHFDAPKQGAMLAAPFVLSSGLAIAPLHDEFWLGPIAASKNKLAKVVPCFSSTGSEEYSLQLPAGRKLVALPADAEIEVDGLKYSSHWSQGDHTVSVKRTLTLSFADPVCRGEKRLVLGNALIRVKDDIAKMITLTNE